MTDPSGPPAPSSPAADTNRWARRVRARAGVLDGRFLQRFLQPGGFLAGHTTARLGLPKISQAGSTIYQRLTGRYLPLAERIYQRFAAAGSPAARQPLDMALSTERTVEPAAAPVFQPDPMPILGSMPAPMPRPAPSSHVGQVIPRKEDDPDYISNQAARRAASKETKRPALSAGHRLFSRVEEVTSQAKPAFPAEPSPDLQLEQPQPAARQDAPPEAAAPPAPVTVLPVTKGAVQRSLEAPAGSTAAKPPAPAALPRPEQPRAAGHLEKPAVPAQASPQPERPPVLPADRAHIPGPVAAEPDQPEPARAALVPEPPARSQTALPAKLAQTTPVAVAARVPAAPAQPAPRVMRKMTARPTVRREAAVLPPSPLLVMPARPPAERVARPESPQQGPQQPETPGPLAASLTQDQPHPVIHAGDRFEKPAVSSATPFEKPSVTPAAAFEKPVLPAAAAPVSPSPRPAARLTARPTANASARTPLVQRELADTPSASSGRPPRSSVGPLSEPPSLAPEPGAHPEVSSSENNAPVQSDPQGDIPAAATVRVQPVRTLLLTARASKPAVTRMPRAVQTGGQSLASRIRLHAPADSAGRVIRPGIAQREASAVAKYGIVQRGISAEVQPGIVQREPSAEAKPGVAQLAPTPWMPARLKPNFKAAASPRLTQPGRPSSTAWQAALPARPPSAPPGLPLSEPPAASHRMAAGQQPALKSTPAASGLVLGLPMPMARPDRVEIGRARPALPSSQGVSSEPVGETRTVPSISPTGEARPAVPPAQAEAQQPVGLSSAPGENVAVGQVQREAAGAPDSPPQPVASSSPAQPPDSAPATEELDLDRIACDVYPVILRKLRIERERHAGRSR